VIGDWFVVLPGGSPAAPPPVAAAVRLGGSVLARCVGQPWIVGRALYGTVIGVRVGNVEAVLIGDHTVTRYELADAVRSVRGGSGWMDLMGFPGSYHMVVRGPFGTVMAGDVAGIRAVFHTTTDAGPVLGTRARVLADLAGDTRLDDGHLVQHLLGPSAPIALAENRSSPYRAVRAVPPGNYASVDKDGAVLDYPWWVVPTDETTLDEGAPWFRYALDRAVTVRAAGSRTVGVELSGGLDSAALSALTAQTCGQRTLNLTRASRDPHNDDVMWARMAAAAHPDARHQVIDPASIPAQFDGWEHPLALDAPGPTAPSPDRARFLWGTVTRVGGEVLLSGKGGDEVLLAPLTYLLSTPGRIARQHASGWAALRGVHRRAILAEAARPRPYAADVAACVTSPMGWENGPWLPGWLTPRARLLLLEQSERAATGAVPLHERPHQHTAMVKIRAIARWSRLQSDAASDAGVRMAYPYCDRHVIEAALSVKGAQRTSPFTFKPLLTTALRGSLPAPLLARRTKGGYSADDQAGARLHRRGLADLLLHDSALAGHGLIEPAALAAAIAGWDRADPRMDLLLHITLNAEVWARTAETRPLAGLMEVTSPCTSSQLESR